MKQLVLKYWGMWMKVLVNDNGTRRCYNIDGLLYWLSGDSCSQHGPLPPSPCIGTNFSSSLRARRESRWVVAPFLFNSPCSSGQHVAAGGASSHGWLSSNKSGESKTSRVRRNSGYISVCQCEHSKRWVRVERQRMVRRVLSVARLPLQFTF